MERQEKQIRLAGRAGRGRNGNRNTNEIMCEGNMKKRRRKTGEKGL
jgi:hypothetical protein